MLKTIRLGQNIIKKLIKKPPRKLKRSKAKKYKLFTIQEFIKVIQNEYTSLSTFGPSIFIFNTKTS